MRISDWSSDVCSSDLTLKMKAIDADIRCEPIPMAGLDLLQRCLPPTPHCQLGREFGISDRRKQIVERRETNCAIDVQQAEILGVGRSEERRVGKECVGTWRIRGLRLQ